MISALDAVTRIKSFTGDRDFRPNYDVRNGDTAWRFGDYCRRHGYVEGRRWAEHIRDRVPGIPADCTLLKTFCEFCEAEILNQKSTTPQ